MNKIANGILLDKKDNVVTVIQAVCAGMTVSWGCTENAFAIAETAVPRFHKIAITDIKEGAQIRKYGHSIGIATVSITKGTHVHTQNCVGTSMEEVR